MPISSGGSAGSGIGAILFSQTLGSDTATIDTGAAGIATGYNMIEILLYLRTDEAVIVSAVNLTFNNDSTVGNYDWTRVSGTQVTASANNFIGTTLIQPGCAGSTAPASVFSGISVAVPGYLSTAGFKSGWVIDNVQTQTAATMQVNARGFVFRSTSAISRAAVTPNTGGAKFKTGSSMVVLGR